MSSGDVSFSDRISSAIANVRCSSRLAREGRRPTILQVFRTSKVSTRDNGKLDLLKLFAFDVCALGEAFFGVLEQFALHSGQLARDGWRCHGLPA